MATQCTPTCLRHNTDEFLTWTFQWLFDRKMGTCQVQMTPQCVCHCPPHQFWRDYLISVLLLLSLSSSDAPTQQWAICKMGTEPTWKLPTNIESLGQLGFCFITMLFHISENPANNHRIYSKLLIQLQRQNQTSKKRVQYSKTLDKEVDRFFHLGWRQNLGLQQKHHQKHAVSHSQCT